MGLLDFIKGSGIVKTVVETVDRHLPVPLDQNKKLELEFELEKLMGSALERTDLAQAEVNKAEAQNRNVFVAGWRPAIGWVGAFTLFMYFGVRSTVATILWTMLTVKSGKFPDFPFSIGELVSIVGGMLGLGYLRTYEKKHGVQDRH